MQINTASPMIASFRPQQRPNPALATDGTSSPAVTFRGTEAPRASAATIMQHWGTSNPEGDLNTDGIVDAQDLAMALNAGNDPVSVVQQNWGSSGQGAAANGDYNGDGAVDAMDLAMALNGGNEPRSLAAPGGDPAPNDADIVANIVDSTFAARDTDSDGALVSSDLEQGEAVFGRLDLDQSGEVGREELTKALFSELERFRAQFPEARTESFARRWLETLTSGRPVADYGQFQRVQQLFGKAGPSRPLNQILSARA